jgi:hypothetical protein
MTRRTAQIIRTRSSEDGGTTHDVRGFIPNENEPLRVQLFGVFGVHALLPPLQTPATKSQVGQPNSGSRRIANMMKRQLLAPHNSPFTVEHSLLTFTAHCSLLTTTGARLTVQPSLFTVRSRQARSDCLWASRRRKPPIKAQDYVMPLRSQSYLRLKSVASSVYMKKPLSRDLTTITTLEWGHNAFRL